MERLLIMFLVTAVGYLIGWASPMRELSDLKNYPYAIQTLLAIGLYGSTYEIKKDLIKGNLRIILKAITIGVFLKTFIIGALIWLLTNDIYAFLLGVIVAQIDPLSVASIDENTNLSEDGNTILKSWSSFDDPMTVILSIYFGSLLADNLSDSNVGLEYAKKIVFNIAFSGIIYIIYKLIKRFKYLDYLLLFAVFPLLIYLNYMLSIAIIGIFLRPNFASYLKKIVYLAFIVSLFIQGYLLSNGINMKVGIPLGIIAVIAQIVVGFLLTYELNKTDRFYLAFAQQNGLTAIILALIFEPIYNGTIAIIAPAIFTINILYSISNYILPKLIKNTEGG